MKTSFCVDQLIGLGQEVCKHIEAARYVTTGPSHKSAESHTVEGGHTLIPFTSWSRNQHPFLTGAFLASSNPIPHPEWSSSSGGTEFDKPFRAIEPRIIIWIGPLDLMAYSTKMLSLLTVPAAHLEGPAQSGSCEALGKYLPAAVISIQTLGILIFFFGGGGQIEGQTS